MHDLWVIQQITDAGARVFSYLDDREIALADDMDEIQEFIWSTVAVRLTGGSSVG